MNRRQLLMGSLGLPLAAQMLPLREVRQSLLVDEQYAVQVIAGVHPTADMAEKYRQQWTKSPFEAQGEFYVDSATDHELPPSLADLPGTLTYFTTTVGVAAQKQSYLVGAFRRENFAYIVRSQVDDSELVQAFGDFFAEAELPSLFEVAWQDEHLRALIPTSDDLGMPLEPTETNWW